MQLHDVSFNPLLMLQKARDLTFRAPAGQLHGRAGRRCILEDGVRGLQKAQQCCGLTSYKWDSMHACAGERVLLQCLNLRPADIEARTVLMQNLIEQNRCRSQIRMPSCLRIIRP